MITVAEIKEDIKKRIATCKESREFHANETKLLIEKGHLIAANRHERGKLSCSDIIREFEALLAWIEQMEKTR